MLAGPCVVGFLVQFLLLLFPAVCYPLQKISGHLTWVGLRAALPIPTCGAHFRVCRQGWGCQCLGFLTCAQMLMHMLHIGFVLTSVQLTNTLLIPRGAVPSDCLKHNWNNEDRSRGKYKDASKQALLTPDTHRNIHRSYSYSRSQLLPVIKQETATPVQIMRQ